MNHLLVSNRRFLNVFKYDFYLLQFFTFIDKKIETYLLCVIYHIYILP